MTQIAFIGGGNMASAIIGGLVASGQTGAGLIRVSDPNEARRQQLQEQHGVTAVADNLEALIDADVVVMAVKPQMMSTVLEPLKTTLTTHQPLLISIAAGITLTRLQQLSGCDAVVRCMPNTPALLGAGATGMVASDVVSQQQRMQADQLLQSAGLTVWLKNEAEIDAVTALSGSGPAYFFLLTEAIVEAGVALGLSKETALKLAVQTGMGAGRMLAESGQSPADLRQQVTSPGGTTEKALKTFEGAHIRDIVRAALTAARDRAEELSKPDS